MVSELTSCAQLGWTLPFAWAIIWTLITIPWVQSDLRREKEAWAENRGQGGIPWTDDIAAPTARTRFESVQGHLPNLLHWTREKQCASSTPSAEGTEGVAAPADNAAADGAGGEAHEPQRPPTNAGSIHDKTSAREQDGH